MPFSVCSSRVGNLPLDGLPAKDDGIPLAWYNMTSSNAALMDHVKTLQTFLEHQVSVKMLLVGVDEIAATRTYASNAAEPIYRQYQEYEAHPLSFYRSGKGSQTGQTG